MGGRSAVHLFQVDYVKCADLAEAARKLKTARP
jgi:hypothetical protein